MQLDIRTYRKKAGLTQEALAYRLSVTSRTVSSWECGSVWPSASQLYNLAVVLNCTPNDLCCWYEEHPEQKTKAVALVHGYKDASPKTRRIVDDLLNPDEDE